MDIKQFRLERGLKAEDLFNVVRLKYPGYDKFLHSRVENEEKYGVVPCPGAVKLIAAHYPDFAEKAEVQKVKKNYDQNRKLKARLYARTTEKMRAAAEKKFKDEGFGNMQNGIKKLVEDYINPKPNEWEEAFGKVLEIVCGLERFHGEEAEKGNAPELNRTKASCYCRVKDEMLFTTPVFGLKK